MSDSEFLAWLEDRLVHVYGESRHVDFVRRLREIRERIVEELEARQLVRRQGQ